VCGMFRRCNSGRVFLAPAIAAGHADSSTGGLVDGGLGPQSLSETEGDSVVEGVVVPVMVPVVEPDFASTKVWGDL